VSRIKIKFPYNIAFLVFIILVFGYQVYKLNFRNESFISEFNEFSNVSSDEIKSLSLKIINELNEEITIEITDRDNISEFMELVKSGENFKPSHPSYSVWLDVNVFSSRRELKVGIGLMGAEYAYYSAYQQSFRSKKLREWVLNTILLSNGD